MHLALKTLLNRVEPLRGFVYEVEPNQHSGRRSRGELGGSCAEDRDLCSLASEPARPVLAVPAPGAGVRPAGGAELSICAAVGDAGLVRVRAAAAGVCPVWHSRRVSALGFGQAPGHAELRLVPRQLGQTAELAGGIPAFSRPAGRVYFARSRWRWTGDANGSISPVFRLSAWMRSTGRRARF